MKNFEQACFLYKNQVKKVKKMLEEFLQPWVLFCLDEDEVYQAAYLFMAKTKDFKKLERRMVEWELLSLEQGRKGNIGF